ncbi:transforming acidic coiled-coil-containing protein 3 [Aplysia californica]|uniref:Transforming acidic coiled-coil-containing protein 3 n=1 Tax=Aplysia californica TaxID=6500 RepID=A0ABM1A5X6_APLCA|nr:transforming acidic coiled-coil-containing protein 3 [Aplysia californica]
MEIPTDENALENLPKVYSLERASNPCKSPLKPVNDERRLTGTPRTQEKDNKTPTSSPFTYIRQLDSAERWIERTSIVTKQDHALNLEHAKDILDTLISSLPVYEQANKWLSDAAVNGDSPRPRPVDKPAAQQTASAVDELASLFGELDITPKSVESPQAGTTQTEVVNQNVLPGANLGTAQTTQLEADDSFHSALDEDDDALQLQEENCEPEQAHSSPAEMSVESGQDPFKCSKQLMNSPTVTPLSVSDSFRPSEANSLEAKPTETENSSEHEKEEDSTSAHSSPDADNEIQITPVNERTESSEISKPHKEAIDSSIHPQITPECAEIATENSEVFTDNPFQCRKQLQNSPVLSKSASPDNVALVQDSVLNTSSDGVLKVPFEPESESVISPSALVLENIRDVCGEDTADLTVDPFKPSHQVANSPAVCDRQTGSLEQEELHGQVLGVDRLQTTSAAESTHDEVKEETISPPTLAPETESSGKVETASGLDINPFETKSQVANSLIFNKATEDGNGIECDSSSLSSTTLINETNLADQEETLLDVNPFETKTQLANSPVPGETLKDNDGKESYASSHFSTMECSKTESPAQETVQGLDVNPFETKSQLANSPIPSKISGGGDEKEVDADPFKPRFQVANSPVLQETSTDSSTPQDAGVAEANTDTEISLQQSSHNSNLSPPEKDKKMETDVISIPACPESTKGSQCSDNILDTPEPSHLPKAVTAEDLVPVVEMDTTGAHVNLSHPEKEQTTSPVVQTLSSDSDESAITTEKNDAAMAEEMEDTSDPFKPSSQLTNSHHVADTSQVFSLPSSDADVSTCQPEDDPFKSKSQLPNSPQLVDDNPFKTKRQIPNSPVQCDDNPFKTKSQLANSPPQTVVESQENQTDVSASSDSAPATSVSEHVPPQKEESMDVSKKENPGNVSVDKIHHLDKAPSTPLSHGSTASTLRPPVSLQFDSNLDERSEDVGPTENAYGATEGSGELDAITGANAQNEPKGDGMPKKEDEELFVPATQAFADPAFLDQLEKAHSSSSVDVKRGSVLLKFDPLQEHRLEVSFAKPSSPGQVQKGTRVSDIFKKQNKSGFLSSSDESVCLFGTPPKVSRRRTLTRQMHSTCQLSIEEETPANQVDMYFDMDNDGDGMASILSDNLLPEESKEGKLVDVVEMPKYTESDLKNIRSNLTLQYQELMLKKDREFQERLKEQQEKNAARLADVEKEKTSLLATAEEEKAKLKEAMDSLTKKNKAQKQSLGNSQKLMNEFDEIIKQLTKDKEELNVQLSQATKQGELYLQDNKELEKSFDDLLHRYDKLKATLEKAAKNEKVLTQAVQGAQEKFKSVQETSKKIKDTAKTKLSEQEEKYNKLETSSKAEITRLEAALKRKEMDVTRLESTLQQKVAENKELTDLCDSLISKVS